ncbi:MAG: Unknown protein [uncultured Sulfurovum sp.]|uniref:Uncharacterized protein n=1 Tax=uncultured Sulfurovum sp. TaxID=269237 RepID=A0A6S6SBY8_9BACT|nr:MAG: Unknown protein [uncultured Sulfurovum sp.]
MYAIDNRTISLVGTKEGKVMLEVSVLYEDSEAKEVTAVTNLFIEVTA